MISRPLFFIFFICSVHISAQVGIGTINPSAQLEIKSTNTGIPALGLNPQTTPIGKTTGQLAVIGDQLFMFDDVRDKWLSVSTTGLPYGHNSTGGENNVLMFGGNAISNTGGPLMPYKGTIVAITVYSESTGNATKEFNIRINGTDKFPFNLVNYKYNNNAINIDFNANETVNVFRSNIGASSNTPIVVLWIKWRS